MEGENDVVRRLNSVDWNFLNAGTHRGTVHALHWFPGNFIPQIPAHFIQILSRPGDVVLDPFCGSGTTGAEAYRLGRRSRQSDVCRAGIHVAEGKLALLRLPRLFELSAPTLEQLHFEGLARREWHGNSELREWLAADTLEQLSFIWWLITRIADTSLRSVLELLFSDVLYVCASTAGSVTRTGGRRRHHWGWIADNVKPRAPVWHNAVRAFRERLLWAAEVARTEARSDTLDATVVWEAVSDLTCQEGEVDLVVTSPPYLGVIDYALANRMSYLWMGWNLDDDRRRELGSRRNRAHRRARERYLQGLVSAVNRIYSAMKPLAYCAVVLGASRKYADTALVSLDLFAHKLKPIWGPVERVVSRRRVAERGGREAKELLCVFRKTE